MSIFSKILSKIFPSSHAETQGGASAGSIATERPNVAAPAPDANAPQVDVEAVLNGMASQNAEKLNWRTSIVDLMKLLGIDSDYDARKALAAEMGREDYSGTAEDNVWLHRRVMQDLGKSGGRVPAEYLD